jgi:hypothetical protein
MKTQSLWLDYGTPPKNISIRHSRRWQKKKKKKRKISGISTEHWGILLMFIGVFLLY